MSEDRKEKRIGPFVLVPRTEPIKEWAELNEAVRQVGRELWAEVVPPLERFLAWLNRKFG